MMSTEFRIENDWVPKTLDEAKTKGFWDLIELREKPRPKGYEGMCLEVVVKIEIAMATPYTMIDRDEVYHVAEFARHYDLFTDHKEALAATIKFKVREHLDKRRAAVTVDA